MTSVGSVLSAGILLHRPGPDGRPQVLLGHMGGPFWARKDAAAWSIPKGEHGPEEDPRAAARREFAEELGSPPPEGELRPLGTVRSGRKTIAAFALAGDLDAAGVVSNTFDLEWPPRSGRVQAFPEIDRAAWFDLDTARVKIVKGQVAFLDRLGDGVRDRTSSPRRDAARSGDRLRTPSGGIVVEPATRPGGRA